MIDVDRDPLRIPLEVFKCNHCSHLFPTHDYDRLTCPNCGRMCLRGEDEILRVLLADPIEHRQAA